ncbi:MAG: hypothetical protein AB7V16_08780 [Vulcanibacillus sp.]
MSATAFQRMRREKAARETLRKSHDEKPLDKMSNTELKNYAQMKGINLESAIKRADILAIIHAAQNIDDEIKNDDVDLESVEDGEANAD